MRLSETAAAVVNELKQYGIKHEVAPSDGNHIRIVWRVSVDKPPRQYFASATPSDFRARLNARSNVRQYLRADGVDLAKKPTPPTNGSVLHKAMSLPEPTVSVPDQLSGIRHELSDLTDLMLDISTRLEIVKQLVTPHPLNPNTPPPTKPKRKYTKRAKSWSKRVKRKART